MWNIRPMSAFVLFFCTTPITFTPNQFANTKLHGFNTTVTSIPSHGEREDLHLHSWLRFGTLSGLWWQKQRIKSKEHHLEPWIGFAIHPPNMCCEMLYNLSKEEKILLNWNGLPIRHFRKYTKFKWKTSMHRFFTKPKPGFKNSPDWFWLRSGIDIQPTPVFLMSPSGSECFQTQGMSVVWTCYSI